MDVGGKNCSKRIFNIVTDGKECRNNGKDKCNQFPCENDVGVDVIKEMNVKKMILHFFQKVLDNTRSGYFNCVPPK